MPTPQWLASAQNGNALPGGDPTGSAVTKVSGADSVANAPARTKDLLTGAGSFEFDALVTDVVFIGLTAQTLAANLTTAANYPYGMNVTGGVASVFHAGSYVTDLTGVLSGVHTFKIETFDSGGGVFKVKWYVDDVLIRTETAAVTLPMALGMVISTLDASVTEIVGTNTSIDNAAPVADAGADININEGQTASLSGGASDDGLPSGTLTYAWTKVSGPGDVTFGNAAQAATTATFSARGVYVLRLTVSDSQLTDTDDLTVSVTAVPVKPVAPTTYDLDASNTAHELPELPEFGAAGTSIIDPSFDTLIIRVTDENTNADDRPWGTASGPATNEWASDDSAFYVFADFGNLVRVIGFNPITGAMALLEEFVSGVEPTFSRSISRPHILYGTEQSNSLLVKQYNLLTHSWSTVYNLVDDVPSLTPGGSQFMGAVYNSEADPELLVIIFGQTQDTHPYVAIVDATNPANRVTINVGAAQLKINGGAWQTLLRHDGSTSTVSVGLHSAWPDRSGKWVQLFYSGAHGGAKKGAFFNMETKRIHEYDDNKWFGHDSLGNRARVTMASGIALPPQWELTDLEQGGVFPVGRLLINPPPNPGDWFITDHNNWNNARLDGVLTPIITGTQATRGGIGGPAGFANLANWSALWDEIAAIATEPGRTKGVDMWYRACHHRVELVDSEGRNVATFRDSPRPQASHGGMWVLFTSNWGLSLGTYGSEERGGVPINHRRDAFLVRMSRTELSTPPPASAITQTIDDIEVELGSQDPVPASPDVELNTAHQFISIIRDTAGDYVDLSTATLIEFIFRKPNRQIIKGTGARLTSYSGDDAAIIAAVAADAAAHYTAPIGAIDVAGLWRRQIKLVFPGDTFYTEDIVFTVGGTS